MNAALRAKAEAFLRSRLARFRPWATPDGYCPQGIFLRGAATHRTRIYRAGNRGGKAQPVDEPVFTPQGWRAIGDLRVGDEVFAGDGIATRVVGVFPQGVRPVARVTFDDGSWTRCDLEHLWRVQTREDRFPRPGKHGGAWRVLSLAELRRRWGDRPAKIQRAAIPVTKPIELAARSVGLDPYVLGVLLGDGMLGGHGARGGPVMFSSADPEIVEAVRASLPPGYSLTDAAGPGHCDYRIRGSGKGNRCAIKVEMRRLGLLGSRSHNKFVPREQLYADVATRTAVLRGLMDTDGSVSTHGRVDFNSVSEQLARDVMFLVQSLGGKATIRTRQTRFTYKGEKKNGKISYRVGVMLPWICPFKLARKAARWIEKVHWTSNRLLCSIEDAGEAECVCIQVAHPEQTYLTRDLIVTHNTFVLGVDTALRLQCWHPHARQRGPVHGWLVGVDWEQGVGGLLWPAVKPWLEESEIKSITYARRSDPEIPIAVSFRNGSLLEFKSSDSDLKKFAGAKLHFAGMDEEMERSYVDEVRARLVDLGGDLSLTLTPVARKVWVRELEREPGTLLVRASMRQAASAIVTNPDTGARYPMLNEQAVNEFLATLGERERAVRESGDFASLQGLVYPEFERAVHVLRPRGDALVDAAGTVIAPWPLPAIFPRVAAKDFGFANPGALLIAARLPGGGLVIPSCYYASGVKIDTWVELAKGVLPPLRGPGSTDGRGRLARPLTCDHDAGDRAMLDAGGVATEPARKAVDTGIALVSRRLATRKIYLVVHDDVREAPTHPVVGRCDAHMLAWELDGYRYPESKDDGPSVRDQPIKKNDHACDALRYLVMAEDGEDPDPVVTVGGLGVLTRRR